MKNVILLVMVVLFVSGCAGVSDNIAQMGIVAKKMVDSLQPEQPEFSPLEAPAQDALDAQLIPKIFIAVGQGNTPVEATSQAYVDLNDQVKTYLIEEINEVNFLAYARYGYLDDALDSTAMISQDGDKYVVWLTAPMGELDLRVAAVQLIMSGAQAQRARFSYMMRHSSFGQPVDAGQDNETFSSSFPYIGSTRLY